MAGCTFSSPSDSDSTKVSPQAEGKVFCAAETKTCADGSTVARIPPDCEFASCATLPTGKQNFAEIALGNLQLTNCVQKSEQPQTVCPQRGDLVAQIKTTKGEIWLKLFPELVPKTVENFTGLAEKKYYDGIIFHRVIPDFMIQTGDPTGTGRGGEAFWGGKFADEFHATLKNLRGAVAMANAGPNTNGSQFFIVQAAGTPWLDQKHSVFGQVFSGLEVVDAIARVERDAADKPQKKIQMDSVRVLRLK